MGYSVAIRTLGTGGEKYAQLMRGLARIEPQPERVVVYIAEGYERPAETYGKEEYVWVKKGMAAQRLLPYDEIDSEYLLMLDDDVLLSPGSIEHLLGLMTRYNADCIGIDTFANHKLSMKAKAFAALTHWVIPHYSKKWAIKVHATSEFSYNNHPTLDFYLAQSAAGPASFWRTKALKSLEIEEERWIEDLGYCYREDLLLFYKLYRNGGKLGYTYRSGIVHLDGATASKGFKQSEKRAYIRAKASLAVWHRTIYGPSRWKPLVAMAFGLQWVWVSLLTVLGSVVMLKPGLAKQHFMGLRDGWRYVHSDRYRSLKPYVIGSHHGDTEGTVE